MAKLEDMTAEQVIAHFQLDPHPEGGFYRETFRDAKEVDGRSVGTAILFLLRAGEVSRWHKVDASEIWHFHAGASLELGIASENGPAERILLGQDTQTALHHVVPAGYWQQAKSLGEWTLVGCTVSPGFEFSGFEMAPEGWEPPDL